ncbi:MAG TPA: DAK2 domain-containing protein [Thermomicrobiaceae bacterium]|nr:DAK2 domain-containing protein [Thermomicrobiaceae bacterium]
MGQDRSRPAGDKSVIADERRRWSGETLSAALVTATELFKAHVPAINALNVFPVPDGDTGTNMYLTLQAATAGAARAVRENGIGAGAALAAAAHGALMGARGNSGVILYQVLAGLAETAGDAAEIDGPVLTSGLRRASDLAYRAVVTPVEGTMLTVMRAAAESADEAGGASIADVLAAALSGAAEALRQTPMMLDILRQAGVVDAGGQGIVRWLEGLRDFASGTSAVAHLTAARQAPPLEPAMRFLDLPELVHGVEEYGYCTNFVVSGDSLPLERFRAEISSLGTSAVVVGDAETLKIHIHSEHPGQILELALRYGELHEVRIDNMSAQTRRLLAGRAEELNRQGQLAGRALVAAIAVVAVAGGSGLTRVFREMGADAVVPAGSTFNPSTADIAGAVGGVSQQQVIILPNDPNVIPTARQVKQLTERDVRVVPSRSIPQGISALSAFNFEASLDDNVADMTAALDLVRSLALSRATRSVEIHGVRAVAGEFIGLLDGALRAAGPDALEVVEDLLAEAGTAEAELVTIFVGEPADSKLAERVVEAMSRRCPGVTVESVFGGQPHYDLLISVE